MNDIVINAATPDEVDVLASTGSRLFVQTYGNISGAEDLASHVEEYFGEESVSKEVSAPGVEYFLAFDKGDIAGFLKVRNSEIPADVPATSATEVQQLYVDTDHQRKGIGWRLMDQAVAVARQRNDEGVWLSVWQEADWAIHFYQAYGFHTVGTTNFWLGDSKFSDYLMWFPLEG